MQIRNKYDELVECEKLQNVIDKYKGKYTSLKFKNVNFRDVNLVHADFGICTFERCRFNDSILQHCHFGDAKFNYCNFAFSNFQGCNLSFADFHICTFNTVCFGLANMFAVHFNRCGLFETNFNVANLKNSHTEVCTLTKVSYNDANLEDASFAKNDWSNVVLTAKPIPHTSHEYISQILKHEAGDDTEKIKVAAYIAMMKDQCWHDFMQLNDPLTEWALSVLEKYCPTARTYAS